MGVETFSGVTTWGVEVVSGLLSEEVLWGAAEVEVVTEVVVGAADVEVEVDEVEVLVALVLVG